MFVRLESSIQDRERDHQRERTVAGQGGTRQGIVPATTRRGRRTRSPPRHQGRSLRPSLGIGAGGRQGRARSIRQPSRPRPRPPPNIGVGAVGGARVEAEQCSHRSHRRSCGHVGACAGMRLELAKKRKGRLEDKKRTKVLFSSHPTTFHPIPSNIWTYAWNIKYSQKNN